MRWGAALPVVLLLGVLASCGSPASSALTVSPAPPPATAMADPDDDAGQDAGSVATTGPHACVIQDGRADRRCTPGATNLVVTQGSIRQTICVPGWTASIRPPASYTTALKRRQMPEYGLTGPLSSVEEDHLIPLSSGGSPTDPGNLWPEPRSGPRSAAAKDKMELANWEAVCSGRMTLAAAQAQILADWTH